MKLIKVTWYDTKTMEAVVSDPDALHSLVAALDSSNYVRQWRLDVPLDTYPWYQEKLWLKLKQDYSSWDYSA